MSGFPRDHGNAVGLIISVVISSLDREVAGGIILIALLKGTRGRVPCSLFIKPYELQFDLSLILTLRQQ